MNTENYNRVLNLFKDNARIVDVYAYSNPVLVERVPRWALIYSKKKPKQCVMCGCVYANIELEKYRKCDCGGKLRYIK